LQGNAEAQSWALGALAARPTQQSRSRRPTRSLLRECGRQLADTALDLGDDARGGTRRFRASVVVVGLISLHRSAHIGPTPRFRVSFGSARWR